jgi:hypothetical protein
MFGVRLDGHVEKEIFECMKFFFRTWILSFPSNCLPHCGLLSWFLQKVKVKTRNRISSASIIHVAKFTFTFATGIFILGMTLDFADSGMLDVSPPFLYVARYFVVGLIALVICSVSFAFTRTSRILVAMCLGAVLLFGYELYWMYRNAAEVFVAYYGPFHFMSRIQATFLYQVPYFYKLDFVAFVAFVTSAISFLAYNSMESRKIARSVLTTILMASGVISIFEVGLSWRFPFTMTETVTDFSAWLLHLPSLTNHYLMIVSLSTSLATSVALFGSKILMKHSEDNLGR